MGARLIVLSLSDHHHNHESFRGHRRFRVSREELSAFGEGLPHDPMNSVSGVIGFDIERVALPVENIDNHFSRSLC
jgi:hypothetical protein